MKRFITILVLGFALAMAQDEPADSSVTRLKMSDIQHFNVVYPDEAGNARTQASEHPFALRQPDDKWFSKDKWMHLTTAYFISLQSTYALNKMFLMEEQTSRKVSIGVTLSFSIGKELFDVFDKKSIFSWKDLTYDVLGAGLGYVTAILIQQ